MTNESIMTNIGFLLNKGQKRGNMYLYCKLFHKRDHFAANVGKLPQNLAKSTRALVLRRNMPERGKGSGLASVNFCEMKIRQERGTLFFRFTAIFPIS